TRAAELRVELATVADPAVGILLTRRGYELVGYENVLGLPLDSDVIDGLALAREADLARGVVVSAGTADEVRAWIQTVADGFSVPDQFGGPPPTESFERDAIVEAFTASSVAEGVVLYFAHRDGVIAGGAASRNASTMATRSKDS